MPKISVIVPIYNTEKYLSQCINSILAQTFTDFELILIDDGSTDNSGYICDKYTSEDSRIVVIHKENGGQSSARNVGLGLARGGYITFVDSDDYYTSNHIFESCIEILEQNNKIDFVQIPHIHEERTTFNQKLHLKSTNDLFTYWLKDRYVTNYLCDKIFRREIITVIKLPNNQLYEDRYVFPIIFNNTHECYLTSSGYYYYRQHEDQTTRRNITTKILHDQIKADENILKYMPKNLTEIYCIVYYRMLSNYMNLLKFEDNNIDLPKLEINLIRLIFTPCKIGIKIRLAILKILGLKIYTKIYK